MILVKNRHNNELHIYGDYFITTERFKKDFIMLKSLDGDFRDFGLTQISCRNINDIINHFQTRINNREYELNDLKVKLKKLEELKNEKRSK